MRTSNACLLICLISGCSSSAAGDEEPVPGSGESSSHSGGAGSVGTGGSKRASDGGAGSVGSGGSNHAGEGGTDGGAGTSTNPGEGGGSGGAPSAGTPGVWVRANVGVTINDGTSAGAQTVVVDPVRPSDFYVFLSVTDNTKMMVLKSTDFGLTWADMNTTPELHGNPWGAAIDPNPNRNPDSPPTLYSPAGFGNPGVWKSIDGGHTWTNTLAGSVFDDMRDCYQIAVLPDDPPNHLLFTYHYNWKNLSEAGLGESTDGGASWVKHQPPTGFGVSQYLMIVDENVWLSIAQGNGGKNGIWRTTTAGRVGGAISTAAWTKVDALEHPHGAFGAFTDPATGDIYAPGETGVKKTTDHGDTWKFIYQGGGICNVVGTQKYLYGNCLSGPNLVRADRNKETTWGAYTTKPADMTQGSPPFGSAVSFDGTHNVIIMDADDNGVWRYVEP